MPDITMCDSVNCPRSHKCKRHQDSGTVPDKYRQSFFYPSMNGACLYFMAHSMKVKPCPDCDGTGFDQKTRLTLNKSPCKDCKGIGQVSDTKGGE